MYISAMLAPDYSHVVVWERVNGERVRKKYPLDLSFLVRDEQGEHEDIYGNKLRRLEFNSLGEYNRVRKGYRDMGKKLYESDIPQEQKVLSKYYHDAEVGTLNCTFFDIEVDYDKNIGHSSVSTPYSPINSISLYHVHTQTRVILAVPPQHSPYEPSEKKYTLQDISTNVTTQARVILFDTEKQMLDKFLTEIANTDILVGWNSDYYDIPYTYKRILENFGKRTIRRLCFPDTREPTIKTVEREISKGFKVQDEIVRLFGRNSLDYKIIYEKFEQENKASYALAYIAEEEFPTMRKLEYKGSLHDLYRTDFSYYLEYNMIDTEILVELDKKKQYIAVAMQLSSMATGQVSQVYGTIKMAELAIINYCHYVLNKKVPDSERHDYFSKYGGAYVLDCQTGEHKMTGAIDVESLYPRSIMSVNASPETIIGQFELNEMAYQSIADKTGNMMVALMESGETLSKTTEEWRLWCRENNYSISGYGTIFDQNKKGMIPAVLESWFAERREYKAELEHYKELLEKTDKDSPEYGIIKGKKDHYYRLQYIKKIQLNSLYGCMGNKFFKFFDIRLAETTTKTGREILFHMVKHVGKVLDGKYAFPTDSVIYGDTDSCYFKTHTTNIQDAKRVCKYVEKSVNDSFLEFMSERFFCTDPVASRVRVENEIISDIGIFVKKKIYLLHLIHKDGYDVDELKIMGHAIKKTHITKIVKKALTEIITNYFKTHDWKQLNIDTVTFKQMLEKSDNFEDYGLPKKINKIEAYTDQYRENPTCNISGGQAAAIFWNLCLDAYEDKESLRATSQMAYRTYYLEKPFGRFQSIAVPADLLVVPDWFIDNFLPIIDRDKQIHRLVDMTLTNICQAINRQIPTEKAVLADEVLVY
jgi:DNA polymerase elongation subunit (family B)